MIIIPTSMDDVLTETGGTPGTTSELGVLLTSLNTYSTGATHSANTFSHFIGFTGGNVWHFMLVSLFNDYGGNVDINIHNESTVDAMSGTLYWEVRDSGHNVLGSGSETVTSLAAGGNVVKNLTYSGTFAYVAWRWTGSLGWNIIP